jgi:hypothetical protein
LSPWIKFEAAYEAYSKHFEDADDEQHGLLNTAITRLHSEISYPEFYGTLDKVIDGKRPFYRSRIKTSRKFAYRKSERKLDRIKRHK